jgi:phosphoglycolate phosphatase-like HAD superfamily hydrolase
MPIDTPRVRALCFDVDGTLSDTDDAWVHGLSHILRLAKWLFPNRNPDPFSRWAVMGIESPANFIYGIPDRLQIDTPLENLTGTVSNTLSRLGWGVRPPNFWLIANTRQALEQLAQRYPMSVVSARNAKGTLAFLKQHDLQPFFHSVVTSLTCSHTKPYPDPVLWAAKQMDVLPEACLMIGDTTVDIRAGKAAGAQTVGVLSGFGSERELRKAGADLILDSVAMLPEALFGLRLDLSEEASHQMHQDIHKALEELVDQAENKIG